MITRLKSFLGILTLLLLLRPPPGLWMLRREKGLGVEKGVSPHNGAQRSAANPTPRGQ